MSSVSGSLSPRGVTIPLLQATDMQQVEDATSLACLVLFKVDLQQVGIERLQSKMYVDWLNGHH